MHNSICCKQLDMIVSNPCFPVFFFPFLHAGQAKSGIVIYILFTIDNPAGPFFKKSIPPELMIVTLLYFPLQVIITENVTENLKVYSGSFHKITSPAPLLYVKVSLL